MEAEEVSRRMQRFETVCRERGLPITTQRRVLIRALLQTNRHPSAEELWNAAQQELPDISRTTVYRVLDTFVDLGLAIRVPHPGSPARFDGNVEPHHHVACLRCRRVYDAFDPDCAVMPRPNDAPPGFRIEGCSVLYTGTCRECLRRN